MVEVQSRPRALVWIVGLNVACAREIFDWASFKLISRDRGGGEVLVEPKEKTL